MEMLKNLSIATVGAAALTLTAVSGASAQSFNFVGAGGDIPDNGDDVNFFESSIVVDQDILIDDVSVLLEGFTHTWIGDLDVDLTFDDGAGTVITANLFDRPGFPASFFGTNADLNGDYTFADGNPLLPEVPGNPVPVVPYGPADSFIAAFGGLNAAGTWTLSIEDWAGGDTGSLGSWTLGIEGEVIAESVPEPASILGLLTIGAIGAAMGRKKKGEA